MLKRTTPARLKKAIIFILLFFGCFATYGQFVNAKLIYKNKSEQEGLVQLKSLPNFNKNEGHTFKFKETEKSKTIKIPSQDLKYLILKDKVGNGEHLFEFIAIKHIKPNKTVITGPFWHKVLRGGREASVYIYAGEYILEKQKIILKSFVFSYYLKKEGEEFGSFLEIGPHYQEVKTLIGENTTFMDNASAFFKDYPALAARIKAKELVFKDIVEIIDLYNNRK